MNKKLLELSKQIKSKKPHFTRQDSHKTGLNPSWRKPNGIQAKMRLHKRGYRTLVNPGHGSPREVKGLHPSGLRIVMVYRAEDLEKVSSEDGAMVGGGVGLRGRILIAKKAKEQNVKLLNIKDSFLGNAEAEMKRRKESKKAKEAESKKKKEVKPKKQLEELTEKEKKEKEEKEKEKIITKKGA